MKVFIGGIDVSQYVAPFTPTFEPDCTAYRPNRNDTLFKPVSVTGQVTYDSSIYRILGIKWRWPTVSERYALTPDQILERIKAKLTP